MKVLRRIPRKFDEVLGKLWVQFEEILSKTYF